MAKPQPPPVLAMGVPHIVLGLLAVFLAYDSQQNATLAAPDLPLEGGEPHHITVPILIEPVGPALPPAPPPVQPRPSSAADPPFTIGGGTPPPPSATGARVEAPFSWLWWWYFDLESRSRPRLSSIWTTWTSQGGLVGAISTALFGDYTRTFCMSVLAITGVGIALAVISYCLWCCTHALALCCLHCRVCRRRAPTQAEPDLSAPPEETPPLRGPHGIQPTDNDFYASIKNIRKSYAGRATPRLGRRRGAYSSIGSTGRWRNP